MHLTIIILVGILLATIEFNKQLIDNVKPDVMYWTKINLSIVYAICLIIALFILIGCVKKVEENPSPTT